MRPPLTVVLINNSGGGIFSFLPIANDMQEDVFTQLWSTPQNVDLAGAHTGLSQEACPALLHCVMTEKAHGSPLPASSLEQAHFILVSIVRAGESGWYDDSMAAGMCRAHGIAHQRVSDRQGLQKALQAAWALNTHSVVEVSVDRGSNVEQHRSIQAAVKAAVLGALHTVTTQAEGDVLSKLHSSVTCGSAIRQMLVILGSNAKQYFCRLPPGHPCCRVYDCY